MFSHMQGKLETADSDLNSYGFLQVTHELFFHEKQTHRLQHQK